MYQIKCTWAQVYVCPSPEGADAVVAVRSRLKTAKEMRVLARAAGAPVYAIKSFSSANLVKAFRTLLGVDPSAGGVFGRRVSAASVGGPEGEGGEGVEGEGGAGGSMDAVSIDGGSLDDDSAAALAAAAAAAAAATAGAPQSGERAEGLEEARLAVESIVLPLAQPVELLPRSDAVRAAQEQLLGGYAGVGHELVDGGSANARLRILPSGGGSSSGGGGGSGQRGEVRVAV